MVAGDETSLDISVGAGSRLFLGTQASTKIYRSLPGRECSHQTHAEVGPDALLMFAPDPVQPFAGSSYTQTQRFAVTEGGSLVFLDWVTSGRSARGERWEFSRLWSRTEVFVCGTRVLLDALRLQSEDGDPSSSYQGGRFNCLATLLMIGSLVRDAASALLEDVARCPVTKRAPLLRGASPFRDGALLRVAGEDVESVRQEIRSHLILMQHLLDDDPWSRKW